MKRQNESENRNIRSRKRFFYLLFSIFYLLFLTSGCAGRDDVAFARRVFTDLVRGRYAARYQIDWPRFSALSKDIGAEYTSLANDEERQRYERAFIDGFKNGFRGQKGALQEFSRWRVLTRTADVKIVAADIQKGKMVLLVGIRSQAGRRKVSELRILEVLEPETFRKFEKEASR
jgi:hypothetical protein